MSDKPKWMEIAEKEIGVKEIPGEENNPRIIEYHDATSLHADLESVSWCSSWMNWVMKKAGIKGTLSAAARSWLNWGEKVDTPQYGDVCIFSRGNNPVQGHVALYVGPDGPDRIKVLGGNQNDSVCIASYPLDRLLGFRRPK